MTKQMDSAPAMLLGREAILGIADTQIADVEVPEWGSSGNDQAVSNNQAIVTGISFDIEGVGTNTEWYGDFPLITASYECCQC